jgi:hypothetical protein
MMSSGKAPMEDFNRKCPGCGKTLRRAHLHHITYNPPRTVYVCPSCHAKIHHPSSKRDLFRPSMYRLCLELIRRRFGGNAPRSAEEIAQAILNDPERSWRKMRRDRPTWREAVMAARVYLQVEGRD